MIDDSARTAAGSGGVTASSFRIESAPARAQSGVASAAGVRVPVRLDAETFGYNESSGEAVFEGRAVYREPGRSLSANRITMPRAADETKRDTIADGSVRFEGDGRKGRGDYARYRGSERTIVLVGRSAPAEVVETATGRFWKGPSLTWTPGADSIPIVSGESGRSTVGGSSRSPGSRTSGEQTDGRKPR